jgi:hypothetical protein
MEDGLKIKKDNRVMDILKKIISVLFILCQTACLKKDEYGFRIFKIKEGNHRSIYRVERRKTNVINFKLILTESCKYQSKSTENQYDINKVFGMSDGSNHKDNSARIGWRYLDDKLELHAYTHYNGQFDFKKICDINPEVEYDCQIFFSETDYKFTVNGITVTMPRYKKSTEKNYLLYPYFGGDEESPHDIIIKISF